MPASRRPSKPQARRPASKRPRSTEPAPGRPVQLELFGARPPAPAPRAASAPPRGKAHAARLSAAESELRRFELHRRLNRVTGGKVSEVSLHDNRRVILTVRAERTGALAPLQLRIHRSFVEAPEEVLQAVAEFVQSRKGSPNARQALGVLREHFQRHRPASGRKTPVRAEGACFDLRAIADDLNERYFAGRIETEVTWGRAARAGCRGRRGKTTIQLGSYSYDEKLVRIHRALDDPSVPHYVVEAVVYHELLHADLPPVTVNGRQHFHTPEFRRRERLFRPLAKAEAWIEEHLARLLSRRGGSGAKDRVKEPRWR